MRMILVGLSAALLAGCGGVTVTNNASGNAAAPANTAAPALPINPENMVLPGGESTTMDKLARAFELFEPLQKRIADGMPAFGTCAGMIMLANEITGGIEGQETLGGLDVTVRRNAFGRQVDSFEADLEFAAFDTPYHAVFIRAPGVESTGAGVEVLAEVDGRPVLCRDGAIMVAAFHPELTDDLRLHEMFLESFDRREATQA